MRVVCDGLSLAEAVMKVSKALPQKTTNPVLDGIKMSAYDDVLTLYATDTDLSIMKKINCTCLLDGDVVVPGKLFTEFIRKLTDEQQIELILNNNQLLVKYTDSQGVLQCLDINEYPNIETIDKKYELLVGQDDLKDIINKVSYFVSTEDTHPMLKGVLLEADEFTLSAVATDRYRLALCKKPLVKQCDKVRIIVPSRSMSEIGKLLDDGEEVVTIKCDEKQIVVDMRHTVITTRLIMGEYMNYKQIIPSQFQSEVLINKDQLANTLDRASILSRGEKKNLVTLEVRENLLTLLANSELGNIKEIISIKLSGKDLNISFNVKFLADCMRAVDVDFVKMSFGNSISPCVITPNESDDFLFLILPLRM